MISVYLDHNATTPLDERVWEAMLPYLRDCYGNPSSIHQAGRMARDAVERARAEVAALVNANPAQVIFTSGGTEANNLALKGILSARKPARLAISAIEHASVRGPGQVYGRQGWRSDSIPVDAQGRVQLDCVEQILHPDTQLVSIIMVNNETGTVQDISRISRLVRATSRALMHTDAVQAAGKIPVDFAASGVHMMSLSAHKIYGPKGVGALIIDPALALEPLLHGGGHERGRRAGTLNVAGIVGFGAAASLAQAELCQRQERWRELRDYLEARLRVLGGISIFSEQAERVLNTVLISVPRFAGETLLHNLDQQGIMVSSGSACSSGSFTPSHVLLAMKVEPALLRNVVRISLGQHTTRADLDYFLEVLKKLLERFAPWDTKSASGT